MATTNGLVQGKLRWMQFLLPLLFLTACGQREGSSVSEDAKTTGDKRSEALQQWRETRAATKANTEPQIPAQAPEPAKTNIIDSVKAKQAVSSFSERLKNIVGETNDTSKGVQARAEQGEAAAQSELAANYWQDGEFDEALKWYLKAAAQGDTRAEHALGVMHVFGQGVEIDYKKAVEWFTKAAEKGSIESQYSLGVRYAKGDHVEQNFAESVKWFSMAANQGSPDAQVSLGRRYAGGEGVTKDPVEAYKWFTIAIGKGNTAGTSLRNNIAKDMTPEQIAEAEKRATEFKPVKTLPK